jgi:S-DNA-T family DNA segregation ATPase FtsK/SpoIIIE
MEACGACGFVYEAVGADELPPRLRAAAAGLADLVTTSDATAVRRRPDAATWSALEYACHLRDVLLVQRERLYLALVEDTPGLVPMYREQRAELARYGDQDPERVARQLLVAAELLADAVAVLGPDQLARTCIYNYPEPAERPLLWLARHSLHEAEHHLADARASLRPGAGAGNGAHTA